MMNPEIEGLLDTTESKFGLVVLGARRARQITSYFGQLGEGLGASVPPQITSTSRKPLSIAFEEVSVEKIVPIELPDEPEIEEVAEAGAGAEAEVLMGEESGETSSEDDESA
ncbi:MAG: DNA-directed RNA polymerase subunit omega [Acidimicrobiaceae bacterium]|nr:DNA-directed RNA polymerase subunit omega [Acidimicrobiaceae bacterium]